jgi:hypothetical protein
MYIGHFRSRLNEKMVFAGKCAQTVLDISNVAFIMRWTGNNIIIGAYHESSFYQRNQTGLTNQ